VPRPQLLKEIIRAIIHTNKGEEAAGEEGIILLLLYFALPPDTLVRDSDDALVNSDHAVLAICISRVKALHQESHFAPLGGAPAPLNINRHCAVRDKAHAPIRQQLHLGHAVRAVSGEWGKEVKEKVDEMGRPKLNQD